MTDINKQSIQLFLGWVLAMGMCYAYVKLQPTVDNPASIAVELR